MKSLALEHRPASLRSREVAPAAPRSRLLAQRRSTLGDARSVLAPPVVDGGCPLDAATRGAMESGFRHDFSSVRVHDDARAHDDARSLGARAYAAGNHLVFAQGAYRPATIAGQALIAHELAHSVQQRGVQMKADGPMPAHADAELEAQADRAAIDVTAGRSVGALTRIGKPAVFRANGDPPAAPDAKTPLPAGSATGLPQDVEVIEETPQGPGATVLVVSLPMLRLPKPKGKGAWVKQGYTAMAAGGRLVFSPIFDGKNYANAASIKAYMEKPGEKYKDVWLNNYGFTSLKALAKGIRDTAKSDADVKAVTDKPDVKTLVDGLAVGTLTAAKCDIDHVVEKQVGGTSVPGNLQILLSDKNQASGRETYQMLVAEVTRILEPNRTKVTQLQMRFKDAQVPDDAEDASYAIEDLLRRNKVKGSEDVKAKGEGTPVQLVAGGASEVVRVRATGATPIDADVRRLIPGMKLVTYTRAPGSTPQRGVDFVEAEIASKPMLKGNRNVTLSATVAPKPAATDPSAGASAEEKEAASEVRALKLDTHRNKDIPFYYPYLSAGKLTKLALDDNNNFTGEGVITPSVRFLGDLKVAFGPDKLDLVQDIDTDAMNKSAFMRPVSPFFRFTSGSVSLDLIKFKPSGKLDLELGPKPKPVIKGTIDASEEGGAFVANGTLQPVGKIPGVTEAKGVVTYSSNEGWSGALTASSASIPNSTTTVKLGFKEQKGVFHPYGEGSITTTVRSSKLDLKVLWGGGGLAYSGKVTVPKPVPLVESVELSGSYANELLTLTGDAAIKWRSIDSSMKVTYTRKDGDEEGRFSGTAVVNVTTDKAKGNIDLTFGEQGLVKGSGKIGYQVTKDVRPTLGVEVTPKHVKVLGEVAVGDIALTKMWPSAEGGKITFLPGVGAKFPVPTPIPGITAYGEIRLSAGLGYGVGPVMLKGVTFNGSLYPLEDDPRVEANLKGKLSVPAYGEIYGTFGAYLGVEALAGAAGLKGGIDVTPALRVKGEGALEFDAKYKSGAFTFSAEAYAKGSMVAKLDVDLHAEAYAGYGLLSHTWTWNVKRLEKNIGPELKLTLGKIAYGEDGKITWPDVSQIALEPKDIDPIGIVKDLLKQGGSEGSTVKA
jgi:hypothetical protein